MPHFEDAKRAIAEMDAEETPKHTPGPWFTNGQNYYMSGEKQVKDHVYVYSAHQRAAICSTFCAESGDEQECAGVAVEVSNARLIAAAPDLLEALKEAHPFVSDDKIRQKIGTIIMVAEGLL